MIRDLAVLTNSNHNYHANRYSNDLPDDGSADRRPLSTPAAADSAWLGKTIARTEQRTIDRAVIMLTSERRRRSIGNARVEIDLSKCTAVTCIVLLHTAAVVRGKS